MYYGIVSDLGGGHYVLTASRQAEKNCVGDDECFDKHLIAFDLFLLSQSPADIVITANSNVKPREGSIDKGCQNAARIGVVYEGTVSTAAQPVQAQYLKAQSGKAKIWEPNYNRHTSFGVKNALNIYNIVM